MGVEAVVHGSIEVMTAEHPQLDPAEVRSSRCKNLEIVDRQGFHMPVAIDAAGRTHIYNAKELCLLDELPGILKAGVSSIRLLLERYGKDEVGKIVSIYRQALDEVARVGSVARTRETAEKSHKKLRGSHLGPFL